jgi:hypothetical protein
LLIKRVFQLNANKGDNIEIKVNGIDEVRKNLENLSLRAKEIEGENKIRLDELFINSFMKKYTEFETLECFAEHCENSLGSDFASLVSIETDKERLNYLIKEKTSFENWDEMLNKAFIEWIARKLQL